MIRSSTSTLASDVDMTILCHHTESVVVSDSQINPPISQQQPNHLDMAAKHRA